MLQPTGSFKIRGVLNWAFTLDPAEREGGFLTFSAGNTAVALGHAARLFGVMARSILPDTVPRYRIDALRSTGVETILMEFDSMMDRVNTEVRRDGPPAFLHPWIDPRMIAGHATIALELLHDWPEVDTVYVPVGGGALAVGVGAVLKTLRPSVRVVGVQAAQCPALGKRKRRLIAAPARAKPRQAETRAPARKPVPRARERPPVAAPESAQTGMLSSAWPMFRRCSGSSSRRREVRRLRKKPPHSLLAKPLRTIGGWMLQALAAPDDPSRHRTIRGQVRELCTQFPVPAVLGAAATRTT